MQKYFQCWKTENRTANGHIFFKLKYITNKTPAGKCAGRGKEQDGPGRVAVSERREKEKRMKHPKSILNTQKGICFIMGTPAKTERHHIFGGPNRKHSERYGLTVELCPYCHRESRHSAHKDGMINHVLQEMGQRAFEEKIGSREEFIKIFGKNYLEDE